MAAETGRATKPMNLIDRPIGWVSPATALRRVQYRRALQVAEAFSYDGAMRGRRTGGWITSNSDANRETFGSMVWLRDRARDLARNNPYAAKALSELVGAQIGTGILPRANTGDDKLNVLIDQKFERWATDCDADGQFYFFGVQWQVARAVAENGECIARLLPETQPQDCQTRSPESPRRDRNQTVAAPQLKDSPRVGRHQHSPRALS